MKKRNILISLLLISVAIGVTQVAFYYPRLPNVVATHFNASGVATEAGDGGLGSLGLAPASAAASAVGAGGASADGAPEPPEPSGPPQPPAAPPANTGARDGRVTPPPRYSPAEVSALPLDPLREAIAAGAFK